MLAPISVCLAWHCGRLGHPYPFAKIGTVGYARELSRLLRSCSLGEIELMDAHAVPFVIDPLAHELPPEQMIKLATEPVYVEIDAFTRWASEAAKAHREESRARRRRSNL